MTYKDFCNNIKEKMITERGYTDVRLMDVRKINDVILQGLCVGSCGDISPTIYLNGLYERYLEGDTTEDILDTIEDMLTESDNQLRFNKEDFMDYEIVRKRVAFKVVNYEKNETLLSEIPHTRILDLAMCFYYLLEDDETCVASILIRNEHLELWGIDKEVLIKDALRNTPDMLKINVITMGEFIRSIGWINELEDDYDEEIENRMLILTNDRKINGAGTFLYDDILPDISDEMHSDLYIIPSSVHEVILVPDNGNIDLKYLKSLVNEVNNTKVSREEILSYQVYEYKREERELKVC